MNLGEILLRFTEIISKYTEEINQRLLEIYPVGPKSLTEPIHFVLNGKGKRLRPLLTIVAAEACGGNKDTVMSSALAIEILHNFTLVHDDIMDRGFIRHGKKTVHNKWDDGIAILTGDAMLSIALELINDSTSDKHTQMTLFIKGLLAVCEGQAMDKEFEIHKTVTIKDYFRMIDLKTGYIIGLSAQIGATAANMDNETSQCIRDYGRLLGRAFQIQDDYLEIFSESSKMGKSLESDIMFGKKTFLMIQAMQKDSEFINTAIKIAQEDITKGMKKIRKYMQMSGIQEITLQEINNIIALANIKLSNLNINKRNLINFSDLIKKRGH